MYNASNHVFEHDNRIPLMSEIFGPLAKSFTFRWNSFSQIGQNWMFRGHLILQIRQILFI